MPPPSWLTDAVSSPANLILVIRVLTQRELSRRTSQRPGAPLHSSYSVSASLLPSNRADNRYADIHAYDRTRVLLGHSRYLNANWVRERMGGAWWIASQAPLPHTAHAFLSMMLAPFTNPYTQSRIRTVVQLTPLVENGRRKADRYFPSSPGQSAVVTPPPDSDLLPIQVTLISETLIPEAHCTQSVVSISTAESRPVTFTHLLYSAWPDHGVPERSDYEKLLAFMRFVDQTNKNPPHDADPSNDSEVPPIVVGCSAGIGRSGTFITLMSLLHGHNLLPSSSSPAPPLEPSPLGPLPEELQNDLVALEIDSLREQRPGMVERPEQVVLIYDVLMFAISKSEA